MYDTNNRTSMTAWSHMVSLERSPEYHLADVVSAPPWTSFRKNSGHHAFC